MHGYDVLGIEPEKWKNEFNAKKADEYGYPQKWKGRFIASRGERLPFEDACFDFVSTYQTLEHEKKPEDCLAEMLRVTMVGGKGWECIYAARIIEVPMRAITYCRGCR